MDLLRNRFYPVDIDRKKIYNRPYETLEQFTDARWGRHITAMTLDVLTDERKYFKDFQIVPIASLVKLAYTMRETFHIHDFTRF